MDHFSLYSLNYTQEALLSSKTLPSLSSSHPHQSFHLSQLSSIEES